MKYRVDYVATYKNTIEKRSFEYDVSFEWQAGARAFADMKKYLAEKHPEPYNLSSWTMTREIKKV